MNIVAPTNDTMMQLLKPVRLRHIPREIPDQLSNVVYFTIDL